jgi:hypothetical protein
MPAANRTGRGLTLNRPVYQAVVTDDGAIVSQCDVGARAAAPLCTERVTVQVVIKAVFPAMKFLGIVAGLEQPDGE